MFMHTATLKLTEVNESLEGDDLRSRPSYQMLRNNSIYVPLLSSSVTGTWLAGFPS